MGKKELTPFKFKEFEVKHKESAFKIGTDAVILGAWANIADAKTILDIGTGCGIIALIVAQRNKKAQVMGLEIDKISATEAVKNFKKSPFTKRLRLLKWSLQEFEDNAVFKFNHIVCNPPFFNSGGTLPTNEAKKNARHTTTLSFEEIIDALKNLTTQNGKLSLVLPVAEAQQMIAIAKQNELFLVRLLKTKARPNSEVDRFFMEFSKIDEEPHEVKELSIRKTDSNEYSKEYKELTKAFYLKF